MTAYKISFIEQFASEAGLRLVDTPLNGFWSGSTSNWISTQDVVILEKYK